jgi:4-hydroxy-4-methyl-2-oxoglutarate aldolase
LPRFQLGDFIVIDQWGMNVGLTGSANTLGCLELGARGFVSNGGVRESDEIILQGIPYWSAFCCQAMVQGRLEFDDKDIPISVGGVQVRPGDMVVADGDGVIVVPLDIAELVTRLAHEEHERDKKNRRAAYQRLGKKEDSSI